MSRVTEGRSVYEPSPHHLAVVCPAERRLLGWISGAPGGRVTHAHLARHFEPETVTRQEFVEVNPQAQALTCPACRNAVVLGLPGQSIERAIEDNLRPILGFFSLPRRGETRPRYRKGQSTPSALRQDAALRPTTDAERDMPVDDGEPA